MERKPNLTPGLSHLKIVLYFRQQLVYNISER